MTKDEAKKRIKDILGEPNAITVQEIYILMLEHTRDEIISLKERLNNE